jgi:hypothetical protein
MVGRSRKGADINATSFRNSLPVILVVDNHLFPIINLYYCCLYISDSDLFRPNYTSKFHLQTSGKFHRKQKRSVRFINYNSSLFNEFVCKLGSLWHSWTETWRETSVLKAHECHKEPNLHTNELNITVFCSTSPLKGPNRLKSLKLA